MSNIDAINEPLKHNKDACIYIDRAIEMLKEQYENKELIAGYNGIVCLLGYAKQSHNAQFKAEQKQSVGVWIRVEDDMPDYDVQVMWYDESGHVFISDIDHDNDWQNFQSWNKDFNGNEVKITHWMRLPLPPNETPQKQTV